MPPNSNYVAPINVLNEDTDEDFAKNKTSKGPFLTDIVWPNTIAISILLVLGLYLFLTFPWLVHYKTAIFCILYGYVGNFGITIGVHRCLAHNAFKVKPPLKILLLLLYSIAALYPVYNWVLDHRMHHKFSDKLGDPHNAKRGLFFSHVGWLMVKKDPIFKNKDNRVDMDDILNDPYIKLFDKYYLPTVFLFSFVIPLAIPCYFWNETFNYAITMRFITYWMTLNIIWSVNSFSHTFGKKTYNKTCYPKENLIVSILTNGEGYHNFHHTFPWDYRACEKGKFSISTYLIDLFAKYGLAYDLKETDPVYMKEIVRKFGAKSSDSSNGMPDEIPSGIAKS